MPFLFWAEHTVRPLLGRQNFMVRNLLLLGSSLEIDLM